MGCSHDNVNWRLIARDDGSPDGTLALLNDWQERLGARMILLDPDAPKNLGLIGNYDAVLAATTARWVLTADPDGYMAARAPAANAGDTEANGGGIRRARSGCGLYRCDGG